MCVCLGYVLLPRIGFRLENLLILLSLCLCVRERENGCEYDPSRKIRKYKYDT